MSKLLKKVNGKKVVSTAMLALVLVFAFASMAYAVIPGAENATTSVKTGLDEVEGVIRTLISSIFALAALIAVGNVVWQGFKMMGSNPGSAEQAKGAIIRTLIGLAVILFAWAIVGVVANILLQA